MRKPPPPLADFQSYPITSAVGISAAAITLMWWAGKISIGLLVMDPLSFPEQPWRLLTSALPHGDVLHLVFNLYWLWVFGTALEEQYGPALTSGLMAGLAAGSMAAEYALFEGGIGLSGVGYGMWAYLAVVEKKDPRFRGAVDEQTSSVFVGWFFICVAMTWLGAMRVANVAHLMGAVLGGLTGATVIARDDRRPMLLTSTIAVLLACLVGATIVRPRVNLRGAPPPTAIEAYKGYQALVADDYETAARHFERAVEEDPGSAPTWLNLGVVYARLGRRQEALAAWEKAVAIDPTNERYRDAVRLMRLSLQGATTTAAPAEIAAPTATAVTETAAPEGGR